MIDPIEAVFAWLRADGSLASLVGARLASKHQYGTAWAQGQPSLVLRASPGQPDADAPLQPIRLEANCYGRTPTEAVAVWMELVRISRGTHRERVSTTRGDALVHALVQASSPSLVYDPEVGMDVCLSFFTTIVGEDTVN